MSRLDQMRDAQWQERLDAEDAVRALIELARFLFGGVRSMVGGNYIERAVDESRKDRFGIDLGAQRRRHFEIGIERPQRVVREQKMMRTGFAGDTHTFFFRPPNEFDAAGG